MIKVFFFSMVLYKMNTETIVYCVVALLLGMLLANMLKNVCGCKTVEGSWDVESHPSDTVPNCCSRLGLLSGVAGDLISDCIDCF
jgi:hypothetical protein